MTRVTQPQLDVFNYLVTKGPHEKGTAAIIGNFCQESGENLDPTMFRAHPDASGGVREDLKSGGMAEWLGSRKTNCIAFSRKAAAERGLPPETLLNDRFTQGDFCVHELTTESQYHDLWIQLTQETIGASGNPRSIATLTANFMTIYERPSKKLNAQGQRIDGLNNRINHAEAVYDRVQLIKKIAGVPTPPPVPSIPVPPILVEPPAVVPPPVMPPVPTVPIAPPPISAGGAGRQAALKDALDAMGASYLAELESYRTEMNAMIDAAIADFRKYMPAPAISPPPASTPMALSNPSASPAMQSGSRPMINMINWKTTLGGFAAILSGTGAAINAFTSGDTATLYAAIPGILAGIGLIAAKDKNVTGGTVSAVDGTIVARPVSSISPMRS